MKERIYYEINEQSARSAHEMMSFRDYKEGSLTAEYKGYVDEAYDLADKVAENRPEEADRVYGIAERYSKKMAANLNDRSRIGCMCPSVGGVEMTNADKIRNLSDEELVDLLVWGEGDCWEAIRDDEGKIIRISVDDDNICITTDPEIEQDYTGTRWSDVQINCNSEQLKELALFAGEPDAYCYMDCTDGERLPICGGSWSSTSIAGVFYVSLFNPRSYSLTSIGFRSAYYGKLDN